MGQVDRGHPAATELALEQVAVGQKGRELGLGVDQLRVLQGDALMLYQAVSHG